MQTHFIKLFFLCYTRTKNTRSHILVVVWTYRHKNAICKIKTFLTSEKISFMRACLGMRMTHISYRIKFLERQEVFFIIGIIFIHFSGSHLQSKSNQISVNFIYLNEGSDRIVHRSYAIETKCK